MFDKIWLEIVEIAMNLKKTFVMNFITEQRWRFVTDGIATTLIITVCSMVIGVILGIIVAAVRSTYDKNREEYEKMSTVSNPYGDGNASERIADAIIAEFSEHI